MRSMARAARAFFFLKKNDKKSLAPRKATSSFCIRLICVFFCFWRCLPDLQDEEVYNDARALSPSLLLSVSLSLAIYLCERMMPRTESLTSSANRVVQTWNKLSSR